MHRSPTFVKGLQVKEGEKPLWGITTIHAKKIEREMGGKKFSKAFSINEGVGGGGGVEKQRVFGESKDLKLGELGRGKRRRTFTNGGEEAKKGEKSLQ